MAERRYTLRHSVHLILAMGWADFVLKYRGSVLGYLWSLIGPLAKFLVILYVFGPYVSPEIPQYPLYLFLGIIIWEHFVVTTNACMSMLDEKAAIIQQLLFPRILLIFMVAWTNLLVFLTYLVVFVLFAMIFHVPLVFTELYIFVLLFQMSLIATGIGMLLSAYSLRYRDILHLWAIVTQILFWLTPITYPYRADQPLTSAFMRLVAHPMLHSASTILDIFVRFQPLSILINDAHRALLYASTEGMPSLLHVLVFTGICLAIFVLGAWVFMRRSKYFLQEY